MTTDVVRVTEKGQATIPAALREKFGIAAPGLVEFVDEGGRLVVKPIPSPKEMMGSLRERLKGSSASRGIREERERDKRREARKFGP